MRWTRRVGIGAVIAVGAMAASAATGFAAPGLSGASSDSQTSDASAIDVAGVVKVSNSHAHSGDDGQSASWSPVVVNGTSPASTTESGWTGTAAVLGGVAQSINAITCPPFAIQLPADSGAVCVSLLNSTVYDDPSASGDIAHGFVATDPAVVTVEVLPSVAGVGCEEGFAYATPLRVGVYQGPDPTYYYPLGDAASGCARRPSR